MKWHNEREILLFSVKKENPAPHEVTPRLMLIWANVSVPRWESLVVDDGGEGSRFIVRYWVLRSQECWEWGTVGTRNEADTKEGNMVTENTHLFPSNMYHWPWPRPCKRRRTGEEVRVRRDMQTSNLESVQRYPAHPIPIKHMQMAMVLNSDNDRVSM